MVGMCFVLCPAWLMELLKNQKGPFWGVLNFIQNTEFQFRHTKRVNIEEGLCIIKRENQNHRLEYYTWGRLDFAITPVDVGVTLLKNHLIH